MNASFANYANELLNRGNVDGVLASHLIGKKNHTREDDELLRSSIGEEVYSIEFKMLPVQGEGR